MTEKEKFLQYIDGQVKLGMVDIHFSWTEEAGKASEEEIYAELNRMIEAPDLPDPEVLGEWSPPKGNWEGNVFPKSE